MQVIQPVLNVIQALQQLPGIGPRSAERLTYHLLRMPDEKVVNLTKVLHRLKQDTTKCSKCFNISEGDLCKICADDQRDQSLIMVVEEPLDVMALEKTGKFSGLYHVLGGVIDPIRGIGAQELRVRELISRVKDTPSDNQLEIIIATNPSTEGETTAVYLRRLLLDQFTNDEIKITRIARGLPVGGDLEYADPITLSKALEGRLEY